MAHTLGLRSFSLPPGATFELVAYSTTRQGVDTQYFGEEAGGGLELRQPVRAHALKSVAVPGCVSMQVGGAECCDCGRLGGGWDGHGLASACSGLVGGVGVAGAHAWHIAAAICAAAPPIEAGALYTDPQILVEEDATRS